MAKKLSKKELEEKVQAFFKTYPDVDKAFVTNDGNVFLSKNRADLHAKSDNDLKVTEYDNEALGTSETSDDKPSTAAELIEFAKTANLEDAEAYLKAEQDADKTRSTVVKAFEARIEELKAEA